MDHRNERVAILGCGVLGTAIARGLLEAGGYEVAATRRSPEGLAELARLGVPSGSDNRAACARATVVVLGVRPQGMREVLEEIAPVLQPGTLCVSIAAGLPLSFYEDLLPASVAVVRTHPSPMMTVRRGFIAVTPGARASAADVDKTRRILGLLCEDTLVMPERDINVFAAVFGSSSALLYLFVEGLLAVEACKDDHDFSPRRLVAGMLDGASHMLIESEKTPRGLCEEICTPNGMTIEGVKAWERLGMTGHTTEAMEAVLARVTAMAKTIR